MCDKTAGVFAHFTWTQPHVTQIQSVCEHFHNENGLVRTRTFCHRKDGWLWHGKQEDRDHGGLAAVDYETSHRPAQRHSAKNTSFNTSCDTPWHDPQTQTAPQTQTTPAFLKWAPDPQIGPRAQFRSPKNPKWTPWLRIIC